MDKIQTMEEIKKIGLYDFISNNGYMLSKDVLIDLIKEYDAAVYSATNKEEYKKITTEFLNNIEENL